MYIKRYTVASFILIALVGWYVYAYISHDTTSIDLFGVVLPALPIAVWIVIPLVLLYLFSVFHMAFHAFLGSMRLRKYDKDYEKIIDAIADAFLAKSERNHVYKTPRYKLLGSIIDGTILFPTQTLKANTQNEKLDAVITLIEDIKRGEVVDLKRYSLKPENALVVQNERNRYKKGDLTAGNILNNSRDYNADFVKEVYTDFVKSAPLNIIEQHKSFLTKEAFFIILSRINASKNALEISNETLISFINVLDLNTKELIEISIALSTGMIPEQRIKLFETLSESREDAIEAYLFTLFDLEMFSPADELLNNSQSDEYLNFKAYRTLRESGKNFNINLFI